MSLLWGSELVVRNFERRFPHRRLRDFAGSTKTRQPGGGHHYIEHLLTPTAPETQTPSSVCLSVHTSIHVGYQHTRWILPTACLSETTRQVNRRGALINRCLICKVYVRKAFVLSAPRLVKHPDKLGLELTEQLCHRAAGELPWHVPHK